LYFLDYSNIEMHYWVPHSHSHSRNHSFPSAHSDSIRAGLPIFSTDISRFDTFSFMRQDKCECPLQR